MVFHASRPPIRDLVCDFLTWLLNILLQGHCIRLQIQTLKLGLYEAHNLVENIFKLIDIVLAHTNRSFELFRKFEININSLHPVENFTDLNVGLIYCSFAHVYVDRFSPFQYSELIPKS